jgi:hypothetical protein
VNSLILDPSNWSYSDTDTKSQRQVEFKLILELEVVELLFPWGKKKSALHVCSWDLFVKFDSESTPESWLLN